jgi:hypothetical protein
MNTCKIILRVCFLALVLLFGAQNGRAQEQPQEPTNANPKPAARSYPIPLSDSGSQQNGNIVQDSTNTLQPDTAPLTGVVNATLGTPEVRHSYWEPGFQYAGTAQSNGFNQQNDTGWFANNYLLANLSLLKAWSRSQLTVNYSGGGFFTTDSTQGNGNTQQLALSQTFQWNRWLVQILDQFSYLPESQFGFGGGTTLGIPGVGGSLSTPNPGLGAGLAPNQSIFTALGPRYSNAGAIQSTYVTSSRGSITASASYAILDFVDPGNVDNNSLTGSLGYNYQIDRANTMGVVYRFTSFQFPGEPQAFGEHVVNVAYGRKITGRLALQLYGGPEFNTFRIPVGNQSSKVGGNGSANLVYGLENGRISAGYFHGLSGGSGVFTGSTVDQVNFTASRRLGRVWSASLNLGYAHNRSVASSTVAGSPSYNNWTVGAGVNRPFGRNTDFAISYTSNINAYSQSQCSGTSCSTNQTSNYISLNVQWHTRPFVLP